MNQTVVQSPNDKNAYKAFILNNGLRVLLIHTNSDQENALNSTTCGDDDPSDIDSENEDGGEVEEITDDAESESSEPTKNHSSCPTKMAAAALCIGVGSFHDPPELPGLTHFLEHMIFMGSKQYPKENHYDAFISNHGGSDNAFTVCERTVFHMDITPKHLKEALNVFAHCFISPLLHPNSMDRELEAVDSEFGLCVAVDDERSDFVLSTFAKPDHPMSKFRGGNKISLKEEPEKLHIDVNAALHKFYQEYYTADRMTLAIQSTDSLETLEKWVTEIFCFLPNNGLPITTFADLTDPFKTEAFPKLYKIVPVKTMDKIFITWALPSVEKYYKTKPLNYISHFLGHEGKGSILAYLKKRCWATSFIAGTGDESGFESNSTGSLFTVLIVLTETGMDHQCDVLSAIFQYIEMLQKHGPEEKYFEELATVCETAFRFQEQEDPGENVARLAEDMQLYPVDHYITGPKLYFEYDPKIIIECLNCLKPTNANIMVLSSCYTEADCKEVEKWTNCKYGIYDIPDEWLTNWKNLPENSELYLPEPNKFIATDFELKHKGEAENKYPVKIFEDEISCIWFKEDVKFKTPKAYIRCLICTPEPCKSAESLVMTDLFIIILNSILAEEAYPANMADLAYHVLPSSEGFIIVISGFNHKLSLLLETVFDHIFKFDPDEGTFQSMKNRLMQLCTNRLLQPEKLAHELELSILRDKYWTSIEKLCVLKSVTMPMLKAFVQKCFEAFFVESLFQGNLTKEEVLSMDKMVRTKMNPQPLAEDHRSKLHITELPVGTAICRAVSPSTEDQNSVIINYYQLGPYNLESSCKVTLLSDFLVEPCFDVLRTREQLGYDVSCRQESICGTYGFKINVQSPSNKFCCTFIDNRIEEFLKTSFSELLEMDEEKFETQRDSLVQCKKCEDLDLDEENRRYWDEINYHRYIFNRKERSIQILENLQHDEFIAWLSEALEHFSSGKRKLSTQVLGPSDEIVLKINEVSKAEFNEEENANESIAQKEKQRSMKSIKFLVDCSENDTTHFISDIRIFKQNLPFYLPSTIDS